MSISRSVYEQACVVSERSDHSRLGAAGEAERERRLHADVARSLAVQEGECAASFPATEGLQQLCHPHPPLRLLQAQGGVRVGAQAAEDHLSALPPQLARHAWLYTATHSFTCASAWPGALLLRLLLQATGQWGGDRHTCPDELKLGWPVGACPDKLQLGWLVGALCD